MISPNQSAPTLPALVTKYNDLNRGNPGFAVYNQLIHTFHSTAIEGSTLSLEETQTWLEKGVRTPGKPEDHHLMLIDHQLAWQQMLTWAAEREPLNRTRLQTITAMIMRQTGEPTNTILGRFDSSQGEFRTVGAMAGSRMFMDARKVPAAVDKLLKELNTALAAVKTIRQIYDLSFLAHFQLVSIHPFGDGNGRTARLLMNYVQQYHGLPLSLVHVADRQAYIKALDQSRQQSSNQPILDFMYNQLLIFLQLESERFTQQRVIT